MFRTLSISQQVILGICLLFLIELLFVGTLSSLLLETKANLEREKHSRTVTSALHRVANITQQAGIRMIRAASPPELLQFAESNEDYHVLLVDLNKELAALEIYLRDEPTAMSKLKTLELGCKATCNYYDAERAKSRLSTFNFTTFCRRMFDLSETVEARSQELIKHYRTLEAGVPARTSKSLTKVKILLWVGLIANIVGAVVLTMILQKRVAGRILVLTDNVRRFTQREPLNPRFQSSDEIGRIDQLFHEMSGAIAQATKAEKMLFDNAADVICQMDVDGNFTSLSPSVHNQWGFEPEQLIGTHYSKVIVEEQRADAIEEMENCKTSISSNRGSFEAIVIGNRKQEISSKWAAYWSPKEKSFFCFVHNISQQKNMEALLRAQEQQVRTAIENVPVGLLMIDSGGFIRTVNHTFERMCDRQRADLIGRSALSLFENIGDQNVDVLASLNQLKPAQIKQVVLKNSTGLKVQVDLSVTLLTVEGKEHRLLVCADATERIKLEKMKHEFVTLLGRHLRAPLDSTRIKISGLLTELQAQVADSSTGQNAAPKTPADKKSERLGRACSNIDRLLRLIDELLDIEKMAPGKLVGELKPTAISEIVQKTMDSVKDFAEQQGISLESKSTEGEIMADSERLIQVAVNLIVNAIKFSPRGEVVALTVQPSDGNVEFNIIDRGRGVPEDMREEIFKPYSQTQVSDGKRGQGTGLGLSICKTIVEAHSGDIGVESNEGKGSRFWFTVPPMRKKAETDSTTEGAQA